MILLHFDDVKGSTRKLLKLTKAKGKDFILLKNAFNLSHRVAFGFPFLITSPFLCII